MTTERIDIVVREDGSRVVRRNIDDIGASTDRTSKALGGLKRLLSGLVAAAAINQVRELADAYTNIQNRLKLTTTSQANLNAVFDELQAISSRTRSSLQANAELYSRLAISAKELGISQKDVLQFTESLNQAIKLSGASSIEAEAGLIQLSQGLASGTLRGDELRSVLEQLPAVADVIAKGLGVTRGELRKMGEQGKITSIEIINAFKDAREELTEKFAKTAPTLAEGFVLLKNQLIETVGAIDQAAAGSSSIGSAFANITSVIRDLTPHIVSFVRALNGTLDPLDEVNEFGKVFATIFIVVGQVLSAVVKTISTVVVGAFKTLGNAIGATAAIIDDIAHGRFSEAAQTYKDAWLDGVSGLVEGSKELYGTLIDDTSQTIEKLDKLWDKSKRETQDRSKLEVGTVGTVAGPAAVLPENDQMLKKQQRELEKLKNELQSVLNAVDPISGALLEQAEAYDTLTKARQKGLISMEEEDRFTILTAQHYRDILDPLGKLNREIDEQATLLGLTVKQREIESQMLSATQQLLTQGVHLTKEETAALREKFTALQDLNEITSIQDQLLAGSVGQRQGFIDQLTAINALLADPTSGFNKEDATAALAQSNPDLFEGTQEAIDAQVSRFQLMYDAIDRMRQFDLVTETTAQQMRAKVALEMDQMRLQNARGFFGNLATLSRSENGKLAAIGKAAAIAQATIDGVLQVQKALASAPPPANYALAAAAGVAAAANVAQIVGTTPGFATGGKFTVGGSGGTDSQMVAFRATPGERVAVSTPQQLRKGDPNGGEGSQAPAPIFAPNIINVRDPKEIPSAIQSSDGRDAIINVISAHAATFREILKSN